MKKLLFLFIIVLSGKSIFSQDNCVSLPTSTYITPYKLMVGFFTTTSLIFPSPIKPSDREYKDIKIQIQPGTENVLNVKALRKDFMPTNLHIYTRDGKVYVFDVFYFLGTIPETYDLTNLDTSKSFHILFHPDHAADLNQLSQLNDRVRMERPFLSKRHRQDKMVVTLQGIYYVGGHLFITFGLSNLSDLPYDIDFSRLYIKDKSTVKRSSMQQRESIPLLVDSLKVIPARTTVQYVLAIDKVTIPEHKKMQWEMYEKNGGRHLAMSISNREIFRARSL